MTAIIIIGIIILIIYATSSKKKPTRRDTTYINPNIKIKSDKEIRDKLLQDIKENIKITVTPSYSSNFDDNDSIIDVTDQSYQIHSDSSLKQYSDNVPYWAHHYVYSYSELKNASIEQKKFYFFFKNKFLNGEYIDLEGNTNYAFILLFNLLEEYENHKDITLLEKQLQALGQNYHKTKSYCNSFLIKKMEEKGDNSGVWRLREEERYSYQNYDYDYWKLGNKYKDKLKLNDEQVKLLNQLWHPNNNFCNIEFCCIEVLKVYISVIFELKAKYVSEGTTIEKEFLFVADIIARKHFKYRSGSQNYKYSIESTIIGIYLNIFRHCENSVREFYGHKRKLNTDTYYTNEEIKTEFESKIISKIIGILSNAVLKVAPPDEATEIELNYHNITRWKIKFEELTVSYNGNPKEFIESVDSLAILNKKIPAGKYIYFEASKFIAKHDKQSALILYIMYVYNMHNDPKFASFANTSLPKTIQKSLFNTNEQLHDFEKIVSELINDKNLDKALNAVSKVYEIKRKKIKLDTVSINDVKQQHFGTVEFLNEYLEDEDDNSIEEPQIIDSKNPKTEIILEVEKIRNSLDIKFTQIQMSTLYFFEQNNYSVLQSEFETFAKSKGIFKNQLIESINDVCYEHLDDILIEEDDESYTLNPNYYQTIIAK